MLTCEPAAPAITVSDVGDTLNVKSGSKPIATATPIE
jgi:hypothetical protein